MPSPSLKSARRAPAQPRISIRRFNLSLPITIASAPCSDQVRALDAAGNPSAFSNLATATTQGVAPPPPVALVQHAETSVTSGTTVSQAFPAASVSGNLIVVTVKWGNQALSASV